MLLIRREIEVYHAVTWYSHWTHCTALAEVAKFLEDTETEVVNIQMNHLDKIIRIHAKNSDPAVVLAESETLVMEGGNLVVYSREDAAARFKEREDDY